MASIHPTRTAGGDEDNAAFGPAEKLVDHKPGHEREAATVADQHDETGQHDRFRASDGKDVPRESLAARIAKARKEG